MRALLLLGVLPFVAAWAPYEKHTGPMTWSDRKLYRQECPQECPCGIQTMGARCATTATGKRKCREALGMWTAPADHRACLRDLETQRLLREMRDVLKRVEALEARHGQ